MSIDIDHKTYLPKPEASEAVISACEGNSKRRLTGYGKTIAFFGTIFTVDALATTGMWLAYWLFHQHVNAYPEGILTLVGLAGTFTAIAVGEEMAEDYTKPVIPKNFEQQIIHLTAAYRFLSQRKDIIKNFNGFAPDRIPEVTLLINATIVEIEELSQERDRVNSRRSTLNPTSGDAASNLYAILTEKYETTNTKIVELEQKLNTLQTQSHEALCSLELAKETGRSVSPSIASQTPKPQLDELGSWLTALAQAYTDTTPPQLP